MKRRFLLHFALVVSCSFYFQTAVAQFPSNWLQSTHIDTAKSSALVFNSDLSINGQGITNQLGYKIFSSNVIESKVFENVDKRLSGENMVAGLDYTNGFQYTLNKKSSKWPGYTAWQIGFADRQHIDTKLKSDHLRLAMFGNNFSGFESGTQAFGSMQFNFLRYQELSVGYLHNYASGIATSLNISYLNGEQFFAINGNNVSLVTDKTDDLLYLNVNGEMDRTSKSNKGFMAMNGSGFSLSTSYSFDVKADSTKIRFTLFAQDIGAIKWNAQSQHLRLDTATIWSGVYVDNLLDLNDSTFSDALPDSLEETLNTWNSKSYSTLLPGWIGVKMSATINKHTSTLLVSYRYNANYSLGISYIHHYALSDKSSLMAMASMGGYGNFDLGLGYAQQLGENFKLTLGTRNIEGLVMPSKSMGISYYLSLKYMMK